MYLAEHHGAEDGYCPAPIVQASAMAGRSKGIRLHFSALLAVLHHPLRLAEDLAVLDLISGGRVEATLGIGYRPHEYEMMGVKKARRVPILEETFLVLEQAWTGEPFEFRGVTVVVRPTPVQKPRPPLYIGGSSEASAYRAARLGDNYFPAAPGLREIYEGERERLGLPVPPRAPQRGPLFLFVTDDPERDWPVVAPHVMYTSNSNATWALERGVGSTPYPLAETIADLQASPQFAVVTPDECFAIAERVGPEGELVFQPLMGGPADRARLAQPRAVQERGPPAARSGRLPAPAPRGGGPMTIAIVGVGETDPQWRDPRPVPALAVEASRLALADAGLSPADVDGFVIEAFSVAERAPADEVAHLLGVQNRAFSAQLGIAGSGTVAAPMLAELAIEAGLADVVVSYYAINLSIRGPGGAYAVHAADAAKAAFEMPFGYYGQPVYFAAQAARYAHEYGLTSDQLGSVAVAARQFAELTPNALRREPLTLDQYLEDAVVADPLRKLDCCLVNDGGVAFVMTSLDRARHLRRPPVVVAGAAFASKPVTQAQYFSQSANLLTTAGTISGPLAFKRAGLSPGDVDVAEIYDCSTISMLLQLEDVGFAAKGEGAAFAASGAIAAGGSLPVNTHGGLLSQSYTVGANHIVEAVRQLRGERADAQVPGAEVALVAGLGAPEHSTLLLTVDR